MALRIGTRFNRLLLFIPALLLVGCFESSPPRLQRFQHTENGAYAADLSRYGNYALVSTAQGITLWQVNQHLPQYVWHHKAQSQNQVISVDIAQDNSHAVTADSEKIAVWSIGSGRNQGYWQVSESPIQMVKISNQGQELAVALQNGVIEHYNLDTGRRLRFLGHNDRIASIDMSANGHFVLSGGYDGKALLWDSRNGQVIRTFPHTGRLTQVKLDQNGEYVFTANSFKESYIWRLATGERVSQLKYTMRQLIFTCVSFSEDGKLLATGAPNRKVKLWDVASGELIAEWRYEANGFGASMLDLTFSEDGQQLIGENSYGLAEIWDISQYTQ